MKTLNTQHKENKSLNTKTEERENRESLLLQKKNGSSEPLRNLRYNKFRSSPSDK